MWIKQQYFCACVLCQMSLFPLPGFIHSRLFCPSLCTCWKRGYHKEKKDCRWASLTHVSLFLKEWIWFTMPPLPDFKNSLIFALEWLNQHEERVFLNSRGFSDNCQGLLITVQYKCESLVFHLKVIYEVEKKAQHLPWMKWGRKFGHPLLINSSLGKYKLSKI